MGASKQVGVPDMDGIASRPMQTPSTVMRRWQGGIRAAKPVDSGSVLVEFALILPLLMTIALGVITGGMVLGRQLSVAHAAREAARYGAVLPVDQCQPIAACGGRNWAELVRSVAVERAGGDAATGGVCVALVQGPGSAPVAVSPEHTTRGSVSPCYVDGSVDSGKRIQVVITRSDQIQLFAASLPVTVSSRATARPER